MKNQFYYGKSNLRECWYLYERNGSSSSVEVVGEIYSEVRAKQIIRLLNREKKK